MGPPPRVRGLKYSLRLNLLSGLPSREAALALIFQSPLDGSTSGLQRLVLADGAMVPNTPKSRSVLGAKLRCAATFRRPITSAPLLILLQNPENAVRLVSRQTSKRAPIATRYGTARP